MKRFYQMETEKKVKTVCAMLIAHRYLCKMKWVSQEGQRTKDIAPEFMFCKDHEDEVRDCGLDRRTQRQNRTNGLACA